LLSELITPVKDFLVVLTGHHWLSKSLLALITWGIVYSITRLFDQKRGDQVVILKENLKSLNLSLVLGGVIIFIFYLINFLID
jgi:hypothetical protein